MAPKKVAAVCVATEVPNKMATHVLNKVACHFTSHIDVPNKMATCVPHPGVLNRLKYV